MTKPTSEEKENLTFKNAVGIQVVGHKKLINKKLEEGMFTFSISKIDYDKNNNKYTVEKQLMTTTNDENGDFSFINFDEYHQTGDYYYVVKEVNNKLSYIDYDKQEYIIHVSVENSDDGLEVSKEILKDSTSVDEIGDLIKVYNNIQFLTAEHINQIHNNQSMLMERERLASLGQLIGGIAHNLKTPIMSISGAAEGLSDLIKEYDSSIDDPEVNSQDHHDIAKDMDSWVLKIKNYTEYMSDVISAVKGQAVALSNDENISFTISELLKRVNILMKHELKNAIIYLNIKMFTDENTVIHGDVNSLVQVINNMVSNAIQAYNGKTEQNIDIIVKEDNNNIYISIKDYACGLSEKVKDKLFKEMITTKGKNGTGLGLYMSYSTIKAHFNGNIVVDSEQGKGTTFTIILPL